MIYPDGEESPLLPRGDPALSKSRASSRASSRGNSRPSSRSSSFSSDPFRDGLPVGTFECKVCGKSGPVPANHSGRVAKCESCGEGTPIRLPPPGKQYVRCVCRCLLVCSLEVTYLRCPRKTCRRVVEVRIDQSGRQSRSGSIPPSSGGLDQKARDGPKCVWCGRLYEASGQDTSGLCPPCLEKHILHQNKARQRCFLFLALALICFLGVGGLVYATRPYEDNHHAIIASWIAMANQVPSYRAEIARCLSLLTVLFLCFGLRFAQVYHDLSFDLKKLRS